MGKFETCSKCKHDGTRIYEYPCNACKHNKVMDAEQFEPMTNADRIRNMSDEELADIIFDDCTIKMGLETCKYLDCDGHDCKKCVLEWLQSEVEEGGEDE